jgi:hypothetical protein
MAKRSAAAIPRPFSNLPGQMSAERASVITGGQERERVKRDL